MRQSLLVVFLVLVDMKLMRQLASIAIHSCLERDVAYEDCCFNI